MAIKHVGASRTPGLLPAAGIPRANSTAQATPQQKTGNDAFADAPRAGDTSRAAMAETERSVGAVDYYAILSSTIGGLTHNTAGTRGEVYEHARAFIDQRLRETQPALSSRVIAMEQIAFDRAIKKIEAEQHVRPRPDRMIAPEELQMAASPALVPPEATPADPAPADCADTDAAPAAFDATDARPPEFLSREKISGDPAARDLAPAVVVPPRQVQAPRKSQAHAVTLRIFAVAVVIVVGLLGYGLATDRLNPTGLRDTARSVIDAMPTQSSTTAEQDTAALPTPTPAGPDEPSVANATPPLQPPDAPEATTEPPVSANNDGDSASAQTLYATQLATFVLLCRPAKTAYGDDPCGNLVPRPFGGPGVTPRKAPEWVAMYDGLLQAVPRRPIKNPKFTAADSVARPVEPSSSDETSTGSPPHSPSTNATAQEKFDHGVVLASADNLDGAVADFSDAIRIDPRFAGAYVQRGQAMFKNGNADGAVADFTQALQIDPHNAGAFKARGMAMLYKGDDNNAIVDLTKAIQYAEIDSASIPPVEVFYARRSRANLYDRKQLYDRELVDLTAMIDGYWKTPSLAAALRTTYREQGAATLLASIYRQRALVNQKRSNPDNAIGDLSLAIQLDPQRSLQYVIERARILESAGRNDQAVADYQQALSLSPANTDVKNALERLKSRN